MGSTPASRTIPPVVAKLPIDDRDSSYYKQDSSSFRLVKLTVNKSSNPDTLMVMFDDNRPRLTDAAIRKEIHRQIIPALIGDSPSRVLDEMSICSGEARVDIAIINGHIHGVEIKSEADTLDRLAGQIVAYNRTFDTVTIICGENHSEKVLALVPIWWGVYTVKVQLGVIQLTKLRCNEFNQSVDKYSLAQLLWKSELVGLLSEAGMKKGVTNKPCRALWKMVAETFNTSALQEKVRDVLKFRESWRLDPQ